LYLNNYTDIKDILTYSVLTCIVHTMFFAMTWQYTLTIIMWPNMR